MEKTTVTNSEYDFLKSNYPDPYKGLRVDSQRLASEQEYFCKYALGMHPRAWQSKFWKEIRDNKRVVACTGRQIGKSVVIAVDALQSAFFNTRPRKLEGTTFNLIVSKSDEQSKEVMNKIRQFIYMGDKHVEQLTAGMETKFFSSQIDKNARNDQTLITFKNGCKIMCLPPTDAVRGYSVSTLYGDEAAFITDDIYKDCMKPTVADTDGKIILTSTPNGQQGYYFMLFDPFEERDEHEFIRLWFDYHCLEYDDPDRVKRMIIEEKLAREMGDEKAFEQESLAMFTSQTGAFFEPTEVDRCVDKEYSSVESWPGHCDLGVDFGKVVSRTVITIVTLDRDNRTIRLLYQYEYPAQNDLPLIEDISALLRRFNIQRVVFESCPAEETYRQMALQKGWNLVEFVPQAEKLKKYSVFRTKVRQGQFKTYNNPQLLSQMKGLQYEETPRTTRIFAGAGLRDDLVDSVVIASKFYLEDFSNVKFYDPDET